MAIFPCDWTGHRYAQPQQSIYITSVWGDDAETAKLRLCPKHFEELHLIARTKMAQLDEDSKVGRVCDVCGKERNAALFLKVFQAHAEPLYYASDLCAGCWQAYRDLVHVASARPLTDR